MQYDGRGAVSNTASLHLQLHPGLALHLSSSLICFSQPRCLQCSRQQRRRQYHHVCVGGQSDALHGLGRIQREEIGVQVENTIIFRSILVVPVSHCHSLILAREFLRRVPVTETLHELCTCS